MAADQQNRTSPLASRSLAIAAALLSLTAVMGARSVSAQATRPSPPAAPAAPAPAPAPVKLDTVTARRGDIQQTVDAAGKLQLHKWADTYAEIGGQVKQVLVAIGDTVQPDQALLEITPTQ